MNASAVPWIHCYTCTGPSPDQRDVVDETAVPVVHIGGSNAQLGAGHTQQVLQRSVHGHHLRARGQNAPLPLPPAERSGGVLEREQAIFVPASTPTPASPLKLTFPFVYVPLTNSVTLLIANSFSRTGRSASARERSSFGHSNKRSPFPLPQSAQTPSEPISGPDWRPTANQ